MFCCVHASLVSLSQARIKRNAFEHKQRVLLRRMNASAQPKKENPFQAKWQQTIVLRRKANWKFDEWGDFQQHFSYSIDFSDFEFFDLIYYLFVVYSEHHFLYVLL